MLVVSPLLRVLKMRRSERRRDSEYVTPIKISHIFFSQGILPYKYVLEQ